MQSEIDWDSSLGRRAVLAGFLGWALAGCSGMAHATKSSAHAVPRREVKMIVVEEARRMGVPVSLALAVAHAESAFDAGAESHKGARGVMQIMPATARGEYGLSPDLLWEPRINVRVGLHFLKRLVRRYRGRVDLALSYYNGGSRVGTWPNARVIPATAKYVAQVQRLRRRYDRQLARELT